jgi:putative hydrolase of the HAD superfamily
MKILSFDLDGTLVHHDYSEWVWRHEIPELVARKSSIEIEKAKAFVFSQYDSIGEGSIEWYQLGYWFDRFGIDEDWKDTMERHADKIRPYPEATEVLDRLRGRFDLVIVSNATREFVSIEMEKAGLCGYFSRVFSATSDFKEVKKTARFYGKICGILGVEPLELIHVGDHRIFDYLTPMELGIKAFFLDRKGTSKGDGIIRNLLDFEKRI